MRLRSRNRIDKTYLARVAGRTSKARKCLHYLGSKRVFCDEYQKDDSFLLMITFHHLKVFSVLESILVDSVRLQSKALHLQCFRQAEFDPGHEE